MADFRLSAKTISRGKGQSAIASAAYRSAERLMDDRTGQSHDYTRRDGVLHAEIIAPDNTPDWMHDRAQLWNSVEAVERRKDAQLAREIQLSLPHELTDEQRLELVRGYVAEQFVNHGMIADIAIHAPSAEGDERNHHAHIMLTMRELTGDGFGKKNRDWNSPEILAGWREQWAMHQNRQLERHDHPARVDHRSYEAQGIDREPTSHLGPVASDMERKGKASRIGDENRDRDAANTNRAMMQIEAARLASHRARFESWAAEKKAELHAAQDLTRLDLSQKHERQKAALEERLGADYGQAKATIKAELHAVERRLAASGLRKVLRNALGRTRTDKTAREQLSASLADIRQREGERRDELKGRQAVDNRRLKSREQDREAAQDRGIDNARKRADQEHAQKNRQKLPRKGLEEYRDRQEARGKKRGTDARPRPEEPTPTPPTRGAVKTDVSPMRDMERENAQKARRVAADQFKDVSPANDKDDTPAPPVEPSERLSLDDRKRISEVHINEADRNKLEQPFKRSTLAQIRERGSRRASDKPKLDRAPKKDRDPT